MKRILLPAALLLSLAFRQASAVVDISWFNDDTVLDENNVAVQAGWLAQLIWSPDNVQSPVDLGNPLVPTEGERVVRSDPTGTGGSIDGNGGSVINVADDTLAGGFLYARVFNTNIGNSSPTLGGAVFLRPPPPSTDVNTVFSAGIVVNQQIVPEPSSLAFGGIAMLVFAVRRLRRN
jgi:hypothetical protein